MYARADVSRLKVAFFIPSLSGGGAERATATIASGLDRDTFESILLLERRGPHAYPADSSILIETLGVTRSRKSLAPLVRFLRRERPDVLYAALPHLNILAAIACRLVRHRPRLIVSVHSNQDRELASVRNGRLMRLIMPWVYRSADAVVVVSEGVARELRPVLGEGPKLRMIHDPLDVERVASLARKEVSHRWFGSDHQVISAMGRLSPEKGYVSLVRAFAVVSRDRPAARLLLMGAGDQEGELVALAGTLGVAERVEILGFQQNPFAYLARSTCFVMSSSWEGFGMAIVEAMASGVAVLSTDCPYGPSEILADGVFGLMARVGSIEDLAQGISRLLDDAPLRQSLVQKGVARARDFDSSALLPKYAQLLLEVGSQPTGPSTN